MLILAPPIEHSTEVQHEIHVENSASIKATIYNILISKVENVIKHMCWKVLEFQGKLVNGKKKIYDRIPR